VLALLVVVSLLSLCSYLAIILSALIHAHAGGSAAHTHISVHPINPEQPFGLQASVAEDPEDLSATSENVLTPLERVFLAGLLGHLPAACAFTLPIRASYARMVDGIWSGGTWIAWGTHNRETPVRLCVPPIYPPATAQTQPLSVKSAVPTANPPSGNHFEVKCVDGTSSPYLAFSGLLGVGLLGIQSRSPLIEKDCRASAATMTEAEREAVCVKRRLPQTWEEARGALEGDVAMRDLLGGVVEGFFAVGEVSHLFAALRSIVFADADLVNRPWMGFYTPVRVRQREHRCSPNIIDDHMIPMISELPNSTPIRTFYNYRRMMAFGHDLQMCLGKGFVKLKVRSSSVGVTLRVWDS
jgi:hypothetical protein